MLYFILISQSSFACRNRLVEHTRTVVAEKEFSKRVTIGRVTSFTYFNKIKKLEVVN